MRTADVVIVGTGHAGAQSAITLRQLGFAGSVVMIGRDSEPPYERPPLSKEYLAGEKRFERVYIRPPAYWSEKDVELVLGNGVTAVDPQGRTVTLSSGELIGYGSLVWAAGGDPRRMTCCGAELDGVHAVRDRADIDRILASLERGARRVAVVGGGYIGLEAAAVLSKLGCEVTLLEALPRVLARVAGEELSRFFEAEHRSHGIDLRLSAMVDSIEGEHGRVIGVRLADGERISCDMVIVGIGILPAVAPLEAAGAITSNGVEVDERCRTSLPDVYAVGDCAAHVNRFADGATIRLESVQNANDMAVVAAKDICGKAEPYDAVPWFWSNQYDLRLQTVGLSPGHDRAVTRGTPADRSFSIIYFKGDRVVALDCVNAARDYVQGRKLVEANSRPDPGDVANSAIALKDLLGSTSPHDERDSPATDTRGASTS